MELATSDIITLKKDIDGKEPISISDMKDQLPDHFETMVNDVYLDKVFGF